MDLTVVIVDVELDLGARELKWSGAFEEPGGALPTVLAFEDLSPISFLALELFPFYCLQKFWFFSPVSQGADGDAAEDGGFFVGEGEEPGFADFLDEGGRQFSWTAGGHYDLVWLSIRILEELGPFPCTGWERSLCF